MKTASKSSILSPGRARDPPTSLSTSLSRRLRTSGSIKNGQASPMFPTGCKKRGSGFENPEPSSPKVTCIGQVRVKTKKQGKKMRNLSRRPSGEMSFRKMEHNQIQRQSSVNSQYHQECSSHRNQRWVHLPLTICETLRGFGSEFSCLFPCKSSSCFSASEREKEGRVGRHSSSCADVFAKWLVAVQDDNGDGGKRRDIELVVEEEEEEDDDVDEGKVIRRRRHVFDEIEIKDYDEERGRVSICIPPKNALLLMRCRSDPVKMEALASRFWDPQAAEDEEEEGDEKNIVEEKKDLEKVEVKKDVEEVFEERRAEENQEADMKLEVEVQVVNEEEKLDEDLHVSEEETEGNKIVVEDDDDDEEEENELSFVTAVEILVNQEVLEGESRDNYTYNSFLFDTDEISKTDQMEDAALEFPFDESKEIQGINLHVEEELQEQEEQPPEVQLQVEESTVDTEDGVKGDLENKKDERDSSSPRLPQCLLLMMCEPKLSMEVSKETWVCSTDFIRWRPQKKKTHKSEQPVMKKRNSLDSKSNNPFAALPPTYPAAVPARSSCSLPAPTSMATMIEQKLVDAVAYEPFVLTRCKSEPMRTASELAQEACFWKNRAMEPTYGVGAAGVGC